MADDRSVAARVAGTIMQRSLLVYEDGAGVAHDVRVGFDNFDGMALPAKSVCDGFRNTGLQFNVVGGYTPASSI